MNLLAKMSNPMERGGGRSEIINEMGIMMDNGDLKELRR